MMASGDGTVVKHLPHHPKDDCSSLASVIGIIIEIMVKKVDEMIGSVLNR